MSQGESRNIGQVNEGTGNNSVAGEGIIIMSEGCTASGKNISIGRGNFNITCVSCEGVVISDNITGVTVTNSIQVLVGMDVSGLSLMNCSGVTVESGVKNFTGINLQNYIATTSDNGTVKIGIAAGIPVRDRNIKKTATFTVDANYDTYYVDASGGAVVVNLVNTNTTYTIKKIDASANAVTLTPQIGIQIDGAGTKATTTQYVSYTVGYSTDDAAWYIK